MAAIAPGSTIGILGGGQLGRMTALAARRLGYHIHVLDPDPQCAAGPVSDRCVTASFDDVEAAADLARHCHVVTFEIEQIALAAALPTSHGKQAEGVVAWVEAHRATERFWAMRRVRPLAALLGREGSDGALGRGGDPALEGDDVEHVGRALLPVEWVVPGQDYLTGADEGGAGEDDGEDERRETRRGEDGCCRV